jgi:hypothetical protein
VKASSPAPATQRAGAGRSVVTMSAIGKTWNSSHGTAQIAWPQRLAVFTGRTLSPATGPTAQPATACSGRRRATTRAASVKTAP